MKLALLILALCVYHVREHEVDPPAPPAVVAVTDEDFELQSAFVALSWVFAITEELVGRKNISEAIPLPERFVPLDPTHDSRSLLAARIEIERVDAALLATTNEAHPEVVQVELELAVSAKSLELATTAYETLLERLEECPAFVDGERHRPQPLAGGNGVRATVNVQLDLRRWAASAEVEPGRLEASIRMCAFDSNVRIGRVSLAAGESPVRDRIIDQVITIEPMVFVEPVQSYSFAALLESKGLVVTRLSLRDAGTRGWRTRVQVSERVLDL